jgi:hypothetical protein
MIHKDVSFQIPSDRMDIRDGSPRLIGGNASRLDVRIDHASLAGPVIADATMAMNASAFHSIRPVGFGGHQRESGVGVADAEDFVDSGEWIMACHSRDFSTFSSVWLYLILRELFPLCLPQIALIISFVAQE